VFFNINFGNKGGIHRIIPDNTFPDNSTNESFVSKIHREWYDRPVFAVSTAKREFVFYINATLPTQLFAR